MSLISAAEALRRLDAEELDALECAGRGSRTERRIVTFDPESAALWLARDEARAGVREWLEWWRLRKQHYSYRGPKREAAT